MIKLKKFIISIAALIFDIELKIFFIKFKSLAISISHT